MLKISVVINTYNADKHLEEVLDSLKDFDEIIICDMYSTDQTLSIAQRYGCKIVMHHKVPIVEPARAFAIAQSKNDWVLVVDADEVVQPALHPYLDEAVRKQPTLAGIYIPRKNYILGRFAKSSYPNHLLRFMRRDKVQWPTTIHAHPTIEGDTFKIPKKRQDLALIHLANESMSEALHKTDRYTDIEIERRIHKKYNYASLLFEPLFQFFKLYILKGGIFGGLPSLIWAVQIAHYKYMLIAKVIESRIKPEDYDKELRS